MKTNTFLSMVVVGFAVLLKIATMVYTSCGHVRNTCVCNDKGRFAICKPERGYTQLPYFPSLPSYVTNVTFLNFKRPYILRDDLMNLTHLHLKILRLHNMHIKYMEKCLFQSFRRLTTLEISHNSELPTYILRDALENITPALQTVDVSSNQLNLSVPDLFKNLINTNLSTLVLAGNSMVHLEADVIKEFRLTTLDLSSSGFGNVTKLCSANFIPLFPNLRNLRLRSTKIKTIPKKFFICFPNLEVVDLTNTDMGFFPVFCHSPYVSNHLNQIHLKNIGIRGNISSKAFQCLTNLTYLELDKNKISNVPRFCKSNDHSTVPNLVEFHLQYTSIATLQVDSFACLPAIQILDLKNNPFQNLPTFCRENKTSFTPKLKSLYLQNTSIASFRGHKFYCLPDLENLDLRNNFFRHVPSFCNEANEGVNPFLRYLTLANTRITYISLNSFRCLPSLKYLDLSYTEIIRLEDNIFSPLGSLKQLKIGHVPSLKSISKYAFNISTLVTLKFYFNDFDFGNISKYTPKYLFKFCPNLTTLDLRRNHFSTGPYSQDILKPLTKLVELSLADNRMDTIYEYAFKYSRTLRRISLSQNKLIGWKENVFENLSKLTHLDIGLNKIAVFNRTSVPMTILNNLKTLNLAYNPFDCGCDMMWFKNWSLKTHVTLLLFPGRYTCETPASMLRQLMISLNLTEEDCTPKNPWIVVITAASSVALLIVFMTILISVQLPTIKNFIYYFRLKRMGYVKLINEQEFRYDAYVVYCEEDEKWVIRNLVPKLESENIRLCIPDREFDVGADRCGEIESAFKESKKVIVILSNNFAKNEWCLWQVNLVEERLRQSGNSAVVFVLYKNISSKNMISSLHRMMKKQPIVTWHEKGTREKIFWKILVLALLSPLGEPPVSVIHG